MPEPVRGRMVRSLDLEELFANLPNWKIDVQLLSKPQGISQGGMMSFASIGLASNLFKGAARARGEVARDQLAFGFDIARAPGRRFGGRPLHCDDAMIGYSGAELDYVTPSDFQGLSLIMPGSLIEAALDQRVSRPAPLSLYRAIRVCRADREALPEIWRLLTRLAEALHSNNLPGGLAAAQFIKAEIVDAAAAVIGLHQAGDDDQPCVWHHRRPIVLKAEEFMRANLAEPIMLHQICAAARASERTVEYAFHDVYGLSAKRFLKLLRLNQVRLRLRAEDPQPLVIQAIAQQAGFWHMGHFSVDYRRLFGESPMATLRRAHIGRFTRPISA